MELPEAIELLESEMEKHNLFEKGWTYGMEKSKGHRTLGQCSHVKKCITLDSVHVAKAHRITVLDTIRHEIAHALVGEGHDHDEWWQMTAYHLGATPSPTCTFEMPAVIQLPYVPTRRTK